MELIAYVYNIQDSNISLKLLDKSKFLHIKSLGGKKKLLSSDWIIPFRDKKELVQIVLSLIEIDVCFLGSLHGWPPSAILEGLKSEGLLHSHWKEIVWVNKDEYKIYKSL